MPSLENNQDFKTLYRAACSIGAAILKSGAATTEAQKTSLIADLKSGDQQRAKAALLSIGTSLSGLNEQRRLAGNLVAQHAIPKDAAQIHALVEHAVVAAKWSYPNGGGPAPDPLDEIEDELPTSGGSGNSGDSDDPSNNSPCLTACTAQAAAGAAVALTTYVTAMVACQALGPFGIVCALVAMGAYAYALYSLDAVIDRCVANCG